MALRPLVRAQRALTLGRCGHIDMGPGDRRVPGIASSLPKLALTMGDPAGVGPEILVRAWTQSALHECCRPLVIGSAEVLRRAAQRFAPQLEIVPVVSVDQAQPTPTRMPCLDVVTGEAATVLPATVDARGGAAAYEATCEATRLALAGEVGGLVTLPLNKAALRAAGHLFPGHTELLAHLCGVSHVAMMLYFPPGSHVVGPGGLGVVHVTLHVALRDVPSLLETEAIVRCVRLGHRAMQALVPPQQPIRIGVAALNPHAGEGGLFGNEESAIIAPAVEQAQLDGIDVQGPLPADTLLARAVRGEFDAVVAMYHDQGHIALKLLDMHSAVNVTLGLPIVRTSVAHGTAFDLAWQGKAQFMGLIHAVELAARLALYRQSTSV